MLTALPAFSGFSSRTFDDFKAVLHVETPSLSFKLPTRVLGNGGIEGKNIWVDVGSSLLAARNR
jgi:hypothetical protein